MMKAFLEKYFPTSRIIMLRKKISGIQQGQDESCAEYYESLERDMLDAASGGSFVDKEPAAGMVLIENRALNQQQYGSSRPKATREKVHEGTHGQVMVCGVCSMQGHVSDQCPQLMESGGLEGVNTMGFQQGTLTKSTQALIASQTHHGNQINAISTDVAEMKKQMSQVVDFMGKFHEQGKLPSGTIPNPHFEQAKAVTTRSGKTLVDPPKPPKKGSTSLLEEEDGPATSKAQVTSPPSFAKPETQGNVPNLSNSVIANHSPSPLPFPSRFAKSKKDEAEKAILETFKKVQINIPLLEAIKQIPKYAKFLKEL
ncbi:uncharacterized protein LOC133723220 [Rosa rugosa]|uniref:uncharacterized protein LOC133723220 n=1 Tax=Rosa rugosa TaxID=74645 RepID=UPI002B405186|nr:uncharacterized protein LOC133723220 [Rosa rugosa]